LPELPQPKAAVVEINAIAAQIAHLTQLTALQLRCIVPSAVKALFPHLQELPLLHIDLASCNLGCMNCPELPWLL
jgi:hypothetical protein